MKTFFLAAVAALRSLLSRGRPTRDEPRPWRPVPYDMRDKVITYVEE